MANTNINTVGSMAVSGRFPETFYDRQLLESAKTRFVHAEFGQKRPIPRNNGNKVNFRRWNLFDPKTALEGLTEGETPTGQSLSQTDVEATVKQYGAYVEVTDLLDLTAYDNVISDSAELLGEQIGTVVEWVTRDKMCATTNVQYAGGVLSRSLLDSNKKLTVEEIRKAVRTLKKNKARPFCDDGRQPHYVCICSPDATYDLQSDENWKNVSTYQNAEAIYSGEIGRLYGVVFVESTEAKVYEQSVLNAVKTSVTDSATFVLKNAPTSEEAAYLMKGGSKINVGSTEYTLAASDSFDPATNTVKLSAAATLSANAIVWSNDAGAVDSTTKAALPVHATLVFGKDAYGVVDVDGKGAVQLIVKPHGSGGTADPLDQRATVGAKVTAYAAVVLNDLWLVKIEHTVS
ncbi:MAG: N4-gp56 family major capsid protein [Clostridiales bacterium]|nr:N4-gp56 family major capsid protein [Clostridiales bacterium]